ncbi:MAG: DUF3179 domain-containing protein [Pseudomonadota bacterium]
MITRRQTLAGIGAATAATALPARSAHAATDAEIAAAFDKVIYGDRLSHLDALEVLRSRGGRDLAAGLIFSLRFTRQDEQPMLALLSELTGEDGPDDWFSWMLWQEAHPEIIPHASYTGLKRDLFLSIDENFDVFLRDEHLQRERMKIRFEEITWGGVKKDGIPSLDNPELINAKDADYLVGSDFVFGVSINGDVRAYPLRIMGWHEMFNEVIGGVPVALAYCTLCGSGILFETDIGRDQPFVFGSSGFLYRSNKLMFDRETHTLWNQFTGKPVVGPLVDSGYELKQRPVVIEPWVRWVERNPYSKVLSLNTGHRRDYGSGVVYEKYFASPKLMFPAQVDQTRQKQKDYVFGIRTFGGAKAWPVTAFEGGRVINDTVAGLNVVLIGDRLGRTVRAYDRGDRFFGPGSSAAEVYAGIETWEVTEEALLGPNGQRAPRVAGHVAYWFAWDGYLGARSEFYEG